MKSSSSINLFDAKKFYINKVQSMINLIISSFKKQNNNFITKNRVIYQVIYEVIMKKSNDFNIMITFIFIMSFDKHATIYKQINLVFWQLNRKKKPFNIIEKLQKKAKQIVLKNC